MKEIKTAVQEINSEFASNQFPEEFIAQYDQLECLASHYGRETFLLQKKNNGELFVAKCYDLNVFSYFSDIDLSKDLDHKGLPRYVDQFKNEKMLCVVREYVKGSPVDEYAEDRPLSSREIIDICVQLCDILSYLHERPQPIIHRDIKPSNIIIQKDGNVVLIDFDIARMFKRGKRRYRVFRHKGIRAA